MPEAINSRQVAYPEETRLNLRLPGKLHALLVKLAEGDGRSLNAEIVRALTEWAIQAEIRQRVEQEFREW